MPGAEAGLKTCSYVRVYGIDRGNDLIFEGTPLKDAYLIKLQKLEDDRGFFARSWCQREFEEHGLDSRFVQANVSYNKRKGTLRGMHYQVAPYRESKLVRCTRGAIYDVIIDLRPESATYLKWLAVELTATNYDALFVPEGFAHGFVTLEDDTEVTYQMSEFYTPGADTGLRYDDPAFAITWPIAIEIISDKDASWTAWESDKQIANGK